MKLTIEGTPDEIQKVLQAIGSGQERNVDIESLVNRLSNYLSNRDSVSNKSLSE